MHQLRYVAAYPFYAVAFIFGAFEMLFATIAMRISGHAQNPSFVKRSHIEFAIGTIFMMALMLSPVFYAVLKKEPRTDPSRLEVVLPMKKEEFGVADPAKLPALVPAVKLTACIFAEKAIRHHVRPEPIALPSCGGHAKVSISDDLIDITVSGVAQINNIDHPFSVTMQHNPPSTTEDGLIVTGIAIGR